MLVFCPQGAFSSNIDVQSPEHHLAVTTQAPGSQLLITTTFEVHGDLNAVMCWRRG